jgi:hypothetical protein
VPSLPPMPMPLVAGLVTVTATVAGVAISEAAIVAISWFALTKVVVCAIPFQLIVPLVEKLLPLTVNMNEELPEVIVLGASAETAGMDPGCAGMAAFELYPHASVKAVSAATKTADNVFMTILPPGSLPIDGVYGRRGRSVSAKCQMSVKVLSSYAGGRVAGEVLRKG